MFPPVTFSIVARDRAPRLVMRPGRAPQLSVLGFVLAFVGKILILAFIGAIAVIAVVIWLIRRAL